MRILGIDPSTTNTGYGVVDVQDHKLTLVDFGVIRTSAKQHFHLRLKKIYDGLTDLITDRQPDVVSIEDIFYSRNPQVALKLGHARGAAILAAVNLSIDVAEYSPREVKQAVTGRGAAAKEQVQAMVQRLLHLDKPPTPLDASDALAIAICHVFRTGNKLSL